MSSEQPNEDSILKAVQTYSASILRLAYLYTKRKTDAEDIAQEVFLAYIQSNPSFNSEEQQKAWFLQVTKNKCLNFMKSGWKRKTIDFSDELFINTKDDHMNLIKQVLSLNEKYRIPIHLFYYEGYSIKEIAKLMGRKESAIGTWLARGRQALKTMLGDE